MIRTILMSGLALLMLVACGQDETATEGGTTSPASAGGNPLFERIDADTPMLAANLETMPDALIDRFWEPMTAMSEFNRNSYEELAEEAQEDVPVIAALLREIGQLDSREAVESRGISSNGYFAMHLVSVYPFIHVQLSDEAAFEAMIQRVASEGGSEVPTRTVGGEDVVWIEHEDLGLAIHHGDGFATVAVVPDDESMLRRVANLDRPSRAYDAADLVRFDRDRGYTGNGSLFVDLAGVLARLLDENDPLAEPVRQAMDLEVLATDASCRSEIDRLFEIFPRLSAGMTELSDDRVSAEFVVEAESSMAERMAAIADTPVGLSGGETRTISGGIAFDLVAARDFAREVVAAWVETPPQCAAFSSIAAQAPDWQRALNQPIPPVITNVRGLRFNMDRLSMSTPGQVDSAEGTLALFVRNPQMLIGMAQMFSPDIAAMDLQPNGEAKPLPKNLIPNLPDLSAFIALGSDAIAVSFGEGQEARLPEALEQHESDGAVLAYTIDFEGYGELMASMMDAIAADANVDRDELPPSDFMSRLAEYYDSSSIAVRLTDRGIVIDSTTTMEP
ncbi:hypothetical protein [Wenzhouxiangella marina]|uniref:Uncharacterized protein n=1 Tax=Wenzhouxiangella marina TaxID=1579979 RepID=A0A0K0XYQ8_9GAMM|nr:hypothetical protein [Wenzhouxiangella marina]AKS42823.1 hypothetical protein WM2015_2462 [Wenzhouxiangella marina]MBB6087498.1 hypothetical protein [Wenzhouxiangella marina]